MRRTTSNSNPGDFADDISLSSHKQQHLQTKHSALRRSSHDWSDHQHQEDGESDHFTYLGSIVSKDGGADEDVGSRINKPRLAFHTLQPIWNSKALSLHTKIHILNANVKSFLLHGSETWHVTNTITNKIQTFVNKCMRHILNIRWPEIISNTDLCERTNKKPASQDIKKRKWGWIDHTLPKPADNLTRQALGCNPQGRHRVGRHRQS
ncbi:hypothetical protein C0Q70_03175 [Pomacea canaliculata]|uniref:DUF6451 domain-containing protein n=1 Tax=Pomacea canaliculata TaxID=400727 RepID=A0A2T7PS30_POMCA|nr:hypothetical protein C0Q70_03175 [Pomacea canaliculata]